MSDQINLDLSSPEGVSITRVAGDYFPYRLVMAGESYDEAGNDNGLLSLSVAMSKTEARAFVRQVQALGLSPEDPDVAI